MVQTTFQNEKIDFEYFSSGDSLLVLSYFKRKTLESKQNHGIINFYHIKRSIALHDDNKISEKYLEKFQNFLKTRIQQKTALLQNGEIDSKKRF